VINRELLGLMRVLIRYTPSDAKLTSHSQPPAMPIIKVGVLAIQGSFAEHLAALARFGSSVDALAVTTPAHLAQVDALILPGGESTAMGVGLTDIGLLEPVRAFVAAGKPVWGVCAGMVLLAKTLDSGSQPLGAHPHHCARSHNLPLNVASCADAWPRDRLPRAQSADSTSR
jgi:putative intracellular protease/amidase